MDPRSDPGSKNRKKSNVPKSEVGTDMRCDVRLIIFHLFYVSDCLTVNVRLLYITLNQQSLKWLPGSLNDHDLVLQINYCFSTSIVKRGSQIIIQTGIK